VTWSNQLAVAFLCLMVSFITSQTAECQAQSKASAQVFEDDRIRVEVPTGWSVQTATESVTGGKPFDAPIGALLTKDKYRLYLLSHTGHASGVEGGRFSEVVEYVFPLDRHERGASFDLPVQSPRFCASNEGQASPPGFVL
jgi:hypothetical protein